MRVRPASAKERLVHQRNRSNTFQAHKDRPESETKLIDYTAVTFLYIFIHFQYQNPFLYLT